MPDPTSTVKSPPPWIVFAAPDAGPGVIGGGNQSARNLLLGMRQVGAEFLPVLQLPGDRAGVDRGESEFGRCLRISLPAPETWADPIATDSIRDVVRSANPGLIHLLDPVPHLGSWLAAVRDLPTRIVYTALDYNWLCVHSHLLTRRGDQCPGPSDAESCLRCHYDHREPAKGVAMRLLHAAARLPIPLPMQPVRKVRRTRRSTHDRLEALRTDMARLDALIAPSQALAERFADNGMPRHKIHHVRYGTQPAAPIPFADRPPVAAGVVFGFAGRMEYDKGPDLLLDALAAIRRTSPHRPRLRVFGGPSPTGFNRSVRQRLASPEFRDWTTLAQFDGKDPRAIDDAHRSIHVFAAPSRWTDNLPNSVLEALQRHTPVLAPDQGSFRELVVPERNGWLYQAESTLESLIARIRMIVDAPDGLSRLPFDVVRTRTPVDEAKAVLAVHAAVVSQVPRPA